MNPLRRRLTTLKAELKIRQRLYNAAERDLKRVLRELKQLEKRLERDVA